MVSPWPKLHVRPDSTIVCPPIWRTPTSKLTRVRVDGFSKDQRNHVPVQRLVIVQRCPWAGPRGLFSSRAPDR